MHYSIIPPEVVFADWDEEEVSPYQEIMLAGRQCIIEPLENNQARIVQLISSDPGDFMQTEYQPGSIIDFSPQQAQ